MTTLVFTPLAEIGDFRDAEINVVSLAPVYFTGAIVTLQPLLRGWQTFVEIRNYGIYGKTDFDEWRERWLR